MDRARRESVLEKLASLQRDPRFREFEQRLEPGDIIVTAPRGRPKGLLDQVYRPFSRKIQGTEYGHASLYVGDGRIADAEVGKGVRIIPVAQKARTHRLLALSPKVKPATRQRAIEYARMAEGAPYSALGAFRAGFLPRGRRERLSESERLRRTQQSGICSGLVANAYDKLRFSDSSRDMVRPSEILRSRQLAVRAHFGRKGEPLPDR